MSVPKWPDFSLHVEDWGDRKFWIAKTDTGRPKTPIFTLLVADSTGRLDGLSESRARAYAEEQLWMRFRRAHPNGCPGRAEGGVLETQPPEATERVSNPSPRLEGSPSENV